MSDKLTEGVIKGQAVIGSAVPYAPYQEFGTKRMGAQPYLNPSLAVVRAKANGTFKKGMAEEIRRGLQNKFKQQISEGVEFVSADLDLSLDKGVDVSIEVLAAAGVAQAKALAPVAAINGGRLRNSIMWKTQNKEGGFGNS